MEERFPQRFGPFALLRLLGVGGMGKAYLGRHPDWPTLLVVKRMHRGLLDDATLLKRFVHEAEVATFVRHANVAALVAMGTVEGEPFFATEYVFGLSIAQVVERVETGVSAIIPLPIALQLGVGLLAGVEAIHTACHLETGEALDLVHRDIGARNVLIGSDGQPRIIDLGLGKSILADWHTATNMFAGSPDYMPPEQALGKRVDRRADVFAAAATVWELVVGKKRIREPGIPQRIARAIEARPEPVSAFRPEASRALEAALLRAMAPDPEERTPQASTLRLALERELSSIAPGFDRARVSSWLAEECATVLAKERRLLDEAEALDVGGRAGEGGHTQILVAHSINFAPLARADTISEGEKTGVTEARDPDVLEDSGRRPRVAPAPPRRGSTVVGSPRTTRRIELLILVLAAIVVLLLMALIASRSPRRSEVVTVEALGDSQDAPAQERAPLAATSSQATDLGRIGAPLQPTTATAGEARIEPIDPSTQRLSPELVAKRRALVARITALRRQRFDVRFQRKLTELGTRVSRARTEEALLEAEARLRRLEREP